VRSSKKSNLLLKHARVKSLCDLQKEVALKAKVLNTLEGDEETKRGDPGVVGRCIDEVLSKGRARELKLGWR